MNISSDLIRAYKNTEYVVFADPQFIILVDKYSHDLQALMYQYECKQAAFITAYNPHSQLVADSQNLKAQTQLINELHNLGYKVLSGQGRDPQGLWPAEDSVLVFNIDKSRAIKFAKKYAQNAIIWIQNDGIPQLLLLNN
ncbi:MAG: DUF3293 domain-containing protein [Aliiglaciecola sp.]|uniref:DUF3293 domain-containing protein n=1 Tax=Aliiglaciecola sp. TaxID=1872441 RepID=UPI003299CCD8